MKYENIILFFLITATVLACKTYTPPDLSKQLKNDLADRLRKVDSLAVIDSFKIIAVDTIVPKMGSIIDDTIYTRQQHEIEEELAHAKTRDRQDSIDYFQGEVNYMRQEVDSLTASIQTADTTQKYGVLARCYYNISKNGKQKNDNIFYFIRNNGFILNSEMLDSFVTRTCREVR